MQLPDDPFVVAERYIQLRKIIHSPSWAETLTRMSDMILMPFITVFLCLFRWKAEVVMIATTTTKAYSAWKDWIEYHHLRFEVQKMFLHTFATGGPRIRTNDVVYLPYVFADAVVRDRAGEPRS
jgi:hypothetical protein